MAYETDVHDDRPVEDWEQDWDWLDPQWGPHAPEIWADLRAKGCTFASTQRYGQAWLPTRHDIVAEIAYDTDHFSSFRVSVARPDSPRRPTPPITSDPPHHHGHRRVLLAPFSPHQIQELEAPTREYCRAVIADLAPNERADVAVDYAQVIPAQVIAGMIGVPESDTDMFRDWVFRNFQLAPKDNKVKLAVIAEMNAYFDELLERRSVEPADDLATLIANASLDGEPMSREIQVGYLGLLLLAGVDTTWSAIAAGLWHFGQHPDEVERLASTPLDDPLWLMATEEVLRFYAPVSPARQVVADTVVAGCPIHEGDQVLLTLPAANRDPDKFERADEFVVDRASNRHSAFGLGIHRCVGSNLARMEMLVAFQEWITAFPTYRLDESDAATTWSSGQVRGPRTAPVRLRCTPK